MPDLSAQLDEIANVAFLYSDKASPSQLSLDRTQVNGQLESQLHGHTFALETTSLLPPPVPGAELVEAITLAEFLWSELPKKVRVFLRSHAFLMFLLFMLVFLAAVAVVWETGHFQQAVRISATVVCWFEAQVFGENRWGFCLPQDP